MVSPEFNLLLGAARTRALPRMYMYLLRYPPFKLDGKPLNISSNSSF
jgi:hypothetical protein